EEPPVDPERTLLLRVCDAVGSPLPDVREAAARATVALTTSRDAAVVGEAARRLLPQRPAIAALTEALLAAVPGDRRRRAPAGRAVLDVLAEDSLASPLRLRLATATLGARPLGELLGDLDAAGWRADVLMSAAHLLQGSGPYLTGRDLRQLES